MEKAEKKADIDWMKLCKAVLLGTLVGFALAMGLLLLVSWGIANGGIAPGQGRGYVMLISALAAFVGTMVASSAAGMKGLLLGLSVGAAMGVIQLMIGALLADGFELSGGKLGVICSALVGGSVAGALGGRRRKNQKRRHKIR